VNSISKNENLANNNKPEVEKQIKHKVKKGETLARIADVYGVNIADIKSLNKIKRDKVKIGDELIIEPDAKNRTKNNSDFAEDVEINRKSTARISSAKTSIHKVKKGETIGMIAAKYGVSEEEIKSLNSDVIEGNTIFAGTKLKVANEDNKGSANAESSKINKLPNYYTIKNGETLSGIARKFGVPVSTILKKNKQLDENKIKSGQQIRLQ
jgi:N-acetylmuramoyl-L-alanine amidase